MKKTDTIEFLARLRIAREEWGKARTEFFSGYEAALSRLLLEACVNYLSPHDIAKALGVSVNHVRKMLRARGLDGRSMTVLSKQAAEALANNAALLGIEPRDMDLMSPLAYLPMGEQMKRELQDRVVSQVTALDGEDEREAERLRQMLSSLGFCFVCGGSLPCDLCGHGL